MGEQADYMLNGDDCSMCGQHIGDGDGIPRVCLGCSGLMDDEVEGLLRQQSQPGKHAARNRRKKERKRNKIMNAKYIGTLPKSQYPWKFVRSAYGILCCNPDHPPMLLQDGKLVIVKPEPVQVT